MVLTSIERRLDRLTINEFADMSERNSPEMISMLFGNAPDVDRSLNGIGQGVGLAYGSSLRGLANQLGMPLDDISVNPSVATARKPVQTAVGIIEAGTVAAWRIEINGIRDGAPLLQMTPTWYLTTDLEPAWTIPFPGQGWHVVVDGDTPLDVTIRFAWSSPAEGAARGYGNANRPVNAVPYVCAAPPGILSTFELPQLVPTLG